MERQSEEKHQSRRRKPKKLYSSLRSAVADFVAKQILSQGQQDVIDAMKVALFENLKRSLVRYAQLDRVEWLMHRREDGEPSDPAQVILGLELFVKELIPTLTSITTSMCLGLGPVLYSDVHNAPGPHHQ